MKKALTKKAAISRNTRTDAYTHLTDALASCSVPQSAHEFMRVPRFIISMDTSSPASGDTHASLCEQTYGEWAYEGDTEPYPYPNEYVLRLHAGDMLSGDALMLFAMAIERAQSTLPDMIYADEAAFDGKTISKEIKKCEYSRITSLSYDIFGAPLAIRRDIYYSSAPPMHNADYYEEYAFKLRCAAKSRRTVHIPAPLLFSCSHRESTTQPHKTAVEPYTGLIRADERVKCGLWHGSFIVSAKARPRLISVIIPNLNAPDALRRLLESIERCCHADKYEIIIADGGSADGRLLKYYSLLTRSKAASIVNCAAAGFAALCNTGAEAAHGDALLFLSRDAEFCEPNTLSALWEQGERNSVSAAGCTMITPQGNILFAGGSVCGNGNVSYPYAGMKADAVRDIQSRRIVDSVRTVSALSGACMYMRTDMYFSSGGFDESFDAPYFEPLLPTGADAELCIRLSHRGLCAVYTPLARIVLHTPLINLAAAPEGVRIRCRDALRRQSINQDPYSPTEQGQ